VRQAAQGVNRRDFAADVAGYSALMGRDEVGTLRTLTAYRVIIDWLMASLAVGSSTQRATAFWLTSSTEGLFGTTSIQEDALEGKLIGCRAVEPADSHLEFRVFRQLDWSNRATRGAPVHARQPGSAFLRRVGIEK
jgi:hypothetical protein